MVKTLKALCRKYKEMILYVVFGGFTTLINIVAYVVFKNLFTRYGLLQSFSGLDTAVSNAIAWFLSVLFAFVTNKVYVFESRARDFKTVGRECFLFFAARFITLWIDTGVMVVGVDKLHFPDFWVKIVSNVIVVTLNYIFSKLFIFKKPKEAPEDPQA